MLYFSQTDGSYTVRGTPQGTEPGSTLNDASGIAEFRLPGLVTVNAPFSFDLHRLIRQHVILITDLFNVFNLAAGMSIEARDVLTFAAVRARQPPLRLQIGHRYTF